MSKLTKTRNKLIKKDAKEGVKKVGIFILSLMIAIAIPSVITTIRSGMTARRPTPFWVTPIITLVIYSIITKVQFVEE